MVSRENEDAAATTARNTISTPPLTSGPSGPLRSIFGHDISGTSSPEPVVGPYSTSTSSRYTSKICASPLTLTRPDLDSNQEAEREARPKKRKQAGGRDTNDDTSTSALAKKKKKKKKMRTISMAMGQKEEKEEKTKQRKVKGKAKNAIDDLFAGLA